MAEDLDWQNVPCKQVESKRNESVSSGRPGDIASQNPRAGDVSAETATAGHEACTQPTPGQKAYESGQPPRHQASAASSLEKNSSGDAVKSDPEVHKAHLEQAKTLKQRAQQFDTSGMTPEQEKEFWSRWDADVATVAEGRGGKISNAPEDISSSVSPFPVSGGKSQRSQVR